MKYLGLCAETFLNMSCKENLSNFLPRVFLGSYFPFLLISIFQKSGLRCSKKSRLGLSFFGSSGIEITSPLVTHVFKLGLISLKCTNTSPGYLFPSTKCSPGEPERHVLRVEE